MAKARQMMQYLNEIKRWQYKDDLYTFFKAAWQVIEPDTPLKENWHLRELCKVLEVIYEQVHNRVPRAYHTIINVPPSTTKSTLITIIFPVWCWVNDPALKFLTMSYAADLAIMHAVKSRDIILSDWYQDLFGQGFKLKFDVNKKSTYANDRGGVRIAVGVLGGSRGKHADILICDDPNNPKSEHPSLKELKAVNSWWDTTVSTRMTDLKTSHQLIVMQRLAKKDLTGYCLDNKQGLYQHICLPAELSDDVRPQSYRVFYEQNEGLLDTTRLDRTTLKTQRIALGSSNYAGQYMQRPVAEGGNLVNVTWFKEFKLQALEERAFDEHSELVWNVYIDGAYTDKQTNAPTALIAAAHYGHNTYIRDVVRVWYELPALLKFIPDFARRNGCNSKSKVVIEPKASGLPAAQMLRQMCALNVILDKAPTKSKEVRLKGCLPYIEAGRTYLLYGAGWQPMFKDELEQFPYGEYADITDTLVIAINRAERDVEPSSIIEMRNF